MRNKWKIILSLALCLLMVLALLPSASADSYRENRDHARPDHEPHMHDRATEKGEPTEKENVVSGSALVLGSNTFTISTEGDTLYRPFTPTQDGYYSFTASSSYDTYGYLTDADLNRITYDDDSGENLNFLIRYPLHAGVTYYIGARFYFSSVTGDITVTVKQHPADACGDNLKWSFSGGKLSITGSGDMWDFSYNAKPWIEYQDDITAVSVTDGVSGIGAYAFYNCWRLTSVTLPDSIAYINADAFEYCSSLESIQLPKNLTAIGNEAFYYSGLTSVTIPASVNWIGTYAFSYCYGLSASTFTVDAANPVYRAQDGMLLSRDGTILYWFLNTDPRTELTVPDGVEEIYYDAFSSSENLESVTLPYGVTTIDYWAFELCENLTTITIPDTLTEVAYGAFYECNALTDVWYQGTAEQRYERLTIDEEYGYNDALLNATWHYLDPEPFDGTLEWNKDDLKFKGATPYVVADGGAWEPRFTVKDAGGSVVDPSNYTYYYRENVDAGTAYVIVTMTGDGYSGTLRGWFKIYLPATTATYVENVTDGIQVTWSPVEGAAGYVIYRRAWNVQSSGWTAFARWDNTTDTYYLDGHDDTHKVYAGTRYQYGVKAYFAQRRDPISGALIGGNVGDNFNLGEVGPLKTTVRITTRDLTKLVAGSRKITAYWSASKNFTGYQIQYATDDAFTKNANAIKIADPKTSSTTLRSLTNGTLYYVRVRSYHEFEGMTYFGGWSNVLSVKPGSGQTVTPSAKKYRAVCVGENSYTSGALEGCVNDMNAMAGMLKGLDNTKFTVKTMPNSTKSQILNAISTQFKDATDNDVSLFSYSGHGVDAGLDNTYQGALVAIDDNYITFKELAEALSKVKGRVIVILDSCFSGAAIRSTAEIDAFNKAAIEAFSGYWLETDGESGERMGEFKKSKFIVITAASYNQTSAESVFDGAGYAQGAFTAALIKGMGCSYPNGSFSGSTPADKNSDKSVTLKELFSYITSITQGWGVSQTAQYYGTDSEVLFKR